ncbi:MAG: cobyric acid synthase [Desulfovibrio sp.]|nr:MAG: cobyric acid synthase [Desulfovibrio sp.]
MLQGASSNAGKSVLAAALCRILRQDGIDVVPFKAQNMALNSFVTPSGHEIGRAQAVQAKACGLEPDARMNPVLLKPNTDTGSQVVVMGKPRANMAVREYVAAKPELFTTVKQAYDSLASEHQAVILEGAGSPAEINLKAHDIVNMAMARHANANVIIAGDIDRGGVFAALVGTMELLDPWERDLVGGYVINRFRGDASLLDPALDFMLERTGKPVLGVVPHIPDLGLPEEDSVTFKDELLCRTTPDACECADGGQEELLDIALVDLPRISNFTDFDALRAEPDVRLRGVRRAQDLDQAPDVLILPGTKSTAADLRFLGETGLAERIVNLARGGEVEIAGICGGFQMLGRTIADPDRVESSSGQEQGLGLLDVATELAPDKVLAQGTARHLESGHFVTGYEIHHGRTKPAGPEATPVPAFKGESGRVTGWADDTGMVWGVYLHGLFDEPGFRRWFLDRVRQRKGLAPWAGDTADYSVDQALNRLAHVVRANLDMAAVYGLLGLSPSKSSSK